MEAKVGRALVILLWDEMETEPSGCHTWVGTGGFLSLCLFYSPLCHEQSSFAQSPLAVLPRIWVDPSDF